MGSVAGGILTPVYFFPRLGVNRTTYVVCAVLALAGAVMGGFGRKRVLRSAAIAGAGLAAMVCAHAMTASEGDLFAFDSAYQSIRIREDKAANGRTERVFLMDGSRSSGFHTDTGEPSLRYVPHVERALAEAAPKTVLVIGSAGFNVPRDVARMDTVARIDAVDIDPSVKEIAERHFLRETLSPKIRFLPVSGRYAVRKFRRAGARYGFTLVDAYLGKGIPEELVTTEFFQDVRSISDHTVLNAGMDRALQSSFARNLLASFRDAFGEVWWKDTRPGEEGELTNVLVYGWPAAGTARWNGEGRPYRDDRNTSDHDRVELMWAP
jgi:spermidine synthase